MKAMGRLIKRCWAAAGEITKNHNFALLAVLGSGMAGAYFHRSMGLLAIFGLATACGLWRLPPFQALKQRKAYHIGLFFMGPIVHFVLVQITGDFAVFFRYRGLVLAANYLLFLSLQLLLLAVCGRPGAAVGLTGTVLVAGGAANHCVYLFRGTALTPGDFAGLTAALRVAASYSLRLDRNLLGAALGLALLVVLCGKNRLPRLRLRQRATSAGAGAVLLGVLAFCLLDTNIFRKNGLQAEYWNAQIGTEKNGLYLNVALLWADMRVRPPKGYSAGGIAQGLEPSDPLAAEQADGPLPTIVMIMNESLADFSFWGEPQLSADYLPYLHQLAKTNSEAHYGGVSVPVFGANTSCSEFEALTGFSLGCGYPTTAPFQTLVQAAAPSAAWYYRALGYKTTALHPENPENWNRRKAWNNLGFETSLFAGDIAFEGERCTDAELYRAVAEQLKATTEPQFLFAVTMQNHGGYEPLAEPEITVTASGADFSMTQEYIRRAATSDAAFRELVANASALGRPLVIVMFGDHLPMVDDKYFEILSQAPTEFASRYPGLARYVTPLVVWSNCGLDLSVFEEVTSLVYLQTLLRMAAGLPLTAQDKLLQTAMGCYPVVFSSGAINRQGKHEPAARILADEDGLGAQLKGLAYNGLRAKDGPSWRLFLPGDEAFSATGD